MSNTAIHSADTVRVVDDPRPTSSSPTTVDAPRGSRRTWAIVAAGAVAAAVAAAGIGLVVASRSSSQPETSAVASEPRADAAESVHGTRAGMSLGSGLGLASTVGIAPLAVRDAAEMSHGTTGSVVDGHGAHIR